MVGIRQGIWQGATPGMVDIRQGVTPGMVSIWQGSRQGAQQGHARLFSSGGGIVVFVNTRHVLHACVLL